MPRAEVERLALLTHRTRRTIEPMARREPGTHMPVLAKHLGAPHKNDFSEHHLRRVLEFLRHEFD